MTKDQFESQIEIYRNDVELYSNEYITGLPDPDMIYKRSAVFLGMLEYIYQNVIKHIINKEKYQNDYELLDGIFNYLYLPLVYQFGYTPTLYMFSSYVHLSDRYIYDLLSGVYKDGSKVNNKTYATVQKWYSICKAAAITRAVDENSIGGIFIAKAAYGLSDTPAPAAPLQISSNDAETLQQIAAKYDASGPPELPDID